MKCLFSLLLFCVPSTLFAQCFTDEKGNTYCRTPCGNYQLNTKKPISELNDLFRQVSNNSVLLDQALKHPSAEYRYVGIYTIALKKMPRYEQLIDILVDDDNAHVRLAARQALVILSKQYGKQEDFGPLPGATTRQIADAANMWRDWFVARKEHIVKDVKNGKK